MILGICGREGAGKTTIADQISPPIDPTYIEINHPWAYVVSQFMDISYEDACRIVPKTCKFMEIEDLEIRDLLETIFTAMNAEFPGFLKHVPKKSYVPTSIVPNEWVQITLADPLKNICAVLSRFSHKLLLGRTQKSRLNREHKYIRFGSKIINGRDLLQIVGTDVFRNRIDPDLWVNLARNKIKKNPQINFVIPDVRFENEYALINELGGELICVVRDMQDLEIMQADRESHQSKWKFLEFCQDSNIILNDSSIESLQKTISIIAF